MIQDECLCLHSFKATLCQNWYFWAIWCTKCLRAQFTLLPTTKILYKGPFNLLRTLQSLYCDTRLQQQAFGVDSETKRDTMSLYYR